MAVSLNTRLGQCALTLAPIGLHLTTRIPPLITLTGCIAGGAALQKEWGSAVRLGGALLTLTLMNQIRLGLALTKWGMQVDFGLLLCGGGLLAWTSRPLKEQHSTEGTDQPQPQAKGEIEPQAIQAPKPPPPAKAEVPISKTIAYNKDLLKTKGIKNVEHLTITQCNQLGIKNIETILNKLPQLQHLTICEWNHPSIGFDVHNENSSKSYAVTLDAGNWLNQLWTSSLCISTLRMTPTSFLNLPTDGEISKWKPFNQLSKLSIEWAQESHKASPAGMIAFKKLLLKLPNLSHLRLAHFPQFQELFDKRLKKAKKTEQSPVWSSLQFFELIDTPITSLTFLEKCPNLNKLTLDLKDCTSEPKIPEALTKQLTKCALYWLPGKYSALITPLSHCLTHWSCWGELPTDFEIDLAAYGKLTSVGFMQTEITESQANALANIPNLNELTLNEAPQLLTKIASRIPRVLIAVSSREEVKALTLPEVHTIKKLTLAFTELFPLTESDLPEPLTQKVDTLTISLPEGNNYLEIFNTLGDRLGKEVCVLQRKPFQIGAIA